MNDTPNRICVIINAIPYSFKCVETAFQAFKDPSRVSEFIDLGGVDARKLGKTVNMRPDWEEVKVQVMRYVVYEKFEQNPELRERLSKIQGDIIEEGKYPDNKFWGVYNGVGENQLGKILMDVRKLALTFYCLVVGSRYFNNYDMMCRELDHLLKNQKDVIIVSGGAKGADSLAERYAKEHNYELKVFPADWNLGKRAGYVRNVEMHEFLATKMRRGVVAFWSRTSKSKGTRHNFGLSVKYSSQIKVYDYDAMNYLSQAEVDEYAK